MRGTFYMDQGTAPEREAHLSLRGHVVLIVVDRANTPTGMWEGTLAEIGENFRNTGEETCHLPSVLWTQCQAIITDHTAPAKFLYKEPFLNYSVYLMTSGLKRLVTTHLATKAEIAALKKRLDIERQTLYAALKASSDPQTLNRLDTMLKDFGKNLNTAQ